jgi:hypothetical protein
MTLPAPDIPREPDTTDPASMLAWVRAFNRATQTNYQRLASLADLVVGVPVASGSTITPRGNIVHVTGTTGITHINFVGFDFLILIFDGVLTVTDGSNLKLAGNFTTTANDTLTLAWDGTNFYEIGRAVN